MARSMFDCHRLHCKHNSTLMLRKQDRRGNIVHTFVCDLHAQQEIHKVDEYMHIDDYLKELHENPSIAGS